MGFLCGGTCILEMKADNVYKHINMLIIDLDTCHECKKLGHVLESYRAETVCLAGGGSEKEGLPENVIFEQRPDRWERTSHRKSWRRSLLGGGATCAKALR